MVPQKVYHQQTKLLYCRKVCLKWLNLRVFNQVNLELLRLFPVITDWSCSWRLWRLHPRRMKHLFDFLLLVWRVIEEVFNCEGVSRCLGQGTRTHAFWRVKNLFWMNLFLYFPLNVDILSQSLFVGRLTRFWILEIVSFYLQRRFFWLLGLFENIQENVLHMISLVIRWSIFFRPWIMLKLICLQSLVEIFDSDQRTLYW